MDVLEEVKFYGKATEYIEYIKQIISSKDKVSLYYGTNNLEKGVEYPIDPIHCIRNNETPSVFELGIGFYLSPYIEIAIGYTHVNSITNMNNWNELADSNKKFNIHSYKIDLSFDNMNIEKCLYLDKFEKELKKTIYGYKYKKYYNKEVDVTIGLMCGKFWDNNTMSYEHFMTNSKLKDDKGIKEFVKDCIDSMTLIEDNSGNEAIPIQYCIHKNEKLLSNHKYYEFTAKDIFEMSFNLTNTDDTKQKSLYEELILKIDKDGVDGL